MNHPCHRNIRLFGAAVIVVLALQGCAGKSGSPNYREARDAGDAAFEAGANQPPNARTLYSMAKILTGQGRDRDAIRLLTRIIEQTPGFLPAYNEIAGIYIRSDRVEDAVAILTAGLKQAPGDGVLNNNLGMCRFLREDYENALVSFQQAVKGMPDSAVFKANEAAALGMLGRPADAAASYRGAMNPSDIETNIEVLRKAHQLGARKPADAGPSLLDQVGSGRPTSRPSH